ncbi:MAG: PaaI family thioesterase [Sphingomonadaceae bacterium]|nr:PaaI family thioesterase [Sphingomonadaceae bacterium]
MSETPPSILPPGSRFDPGLASRMMTRHGHGGWLGIRYHDHGENWVELSLPWREDLVGIDGKGVLASGPIISLMDNATSMSVWTMTGQFVPHATLDLRVDYMRAASPGQTVIGRGECYKLTRTISFIRGIAHDGDPADPVAHVIGTFMATHGSYL